MAIIPSFPTHVAKYSRADLMDLADLNLSSMLLGAHVEAMPKLATATTRPATKLSSLLDFQKISHVFTT